ncbi:MAG: SNF2 helicase associated domain-containing protein [Candidatus Omnitrophica bacterium]|nr:SNF2 helicase associated domain-containing protein [Candidatus Omnitrophota bacterium]
MALTFPQVKKIAGGTTFTRGEEYYRAGMVRSLAWEGPQVKAEVSGSRRRPYQVTASFTRGAPVVRCTCPSDWGGLCKHGVAVLLYLIDHGEPCTSDEPEALEADTPENQASGFKDFLAAADEAPSLRLGLTVKSLQTVSDRGVVFSLAVCYRGKVQKVVDIEQLLSLAAHGAAEQFPSLPMFTHGQEHFLTMLRGFIPAASEDHQRAHWRVQPYQLAILIEHISREAGIEIVDIKSQQKLAFIQEPPIGLRVTVRAAARKKLEVSASLHDPLQPQRVFDSGAILAGSRLWVFDQEALVFRVLQAKIEQRFLGYFLNSGRILDEEERQYFLVGVLPKLREFAEITFDDPAAYEMRVLAPELKPRYEIDTARGELVVSLIFDYGGVKLDYAGRSAGKYLEQIVDGTGVLVRRDIGREEALADELVKLYGLVPDGREGRFVVSSAEGMFELLAVHIPALARNGEVFVSDKAKRLFQPDAVITPLVRFSSSGIDWFSYDISFSRLGQSIDIPLKVVEEHLAAERKFVRLKSGEFVRLDTAAFERIAALMDERKDKGRLMTAHIPFILDELKAAGVGLQIDPATQKLYDELKGFQGIDAAAIPASLDGVLRDYQRHGVSWMAFLNKFRFGGILADEMGLGKTLQALAMIQRDIEGGCTLPSLVVCPTTLVWNWEAEIRKFLPGLKVLVIGGNERRAQIQKAPTAAVVITSYALLRRDIEHYHQHKFHYLILDEAQNIKNRHTISARVTKRLNADNRLALTGTPLENSVADIWSIFDFLMPSFLGEYERFREVYEVPITQDRNTDKLRELARRIAPFVFRRMKHDVIKELPEKIEQTSYCELEPAQAKLYAAMADKARVEAMNAYRTKGLQGSRMLILTLILRLRQICCHPELAGAGIKHRIGISAKTDLLKEMLGEILSSGHRVLVFSQFVGMLEIIRDHLTKEQIAFEYMDGRTQDRQKRVEHFNSDPTVQVFLLSLKTGGLGLNLTSADTVILYEPWWNPAVEQQAIDRTHRIGQKKAVVAYHLIARGTIEEKILELQERKKFLMSSLVLSDESIAKKLGWDDIKFLLDIK